MLLIKIEHSWMACMVAWVGQMYTVTDVHSELQELQQAYVPARQVFYFQYLLLLGVSEASKPLVIPINVPKQVCDSGFFFLFSHV